MAQPTSTFHSPRNASAQRKAAATARLQFSDLDDHLSEMQDAADAIDKKMLAAVDKLLDAIRRRLHMDIVFIARFHNGRRVFDRVSARPVYAVVGPGDSSPSEESWCQCIVDGRLPRIIHDTAQTAAVQHAPVLPFPLKSHMGTPIFLSDGRVYGTVCCASFDEANMALAEPHLHLLTHVAQMVASMVERRGRPLCGSGG